METTFLAVYILDQCNLSTLTLFSSRSTFCSAPYVMLIRQINKVKLTPFSLLTYQLISDKVQMFAEHDHCKICPFARFTNCFFQQPIARHWNRQNTISSKSKKVTEIINSTVTERSLSIWAELCRRSAQRVLIGCLDNSNRHISQSDVFQMQITFSTVFVSFGR